MNKPIHIIDTNNSNNVTRGRFGIGIINKLRNTKVSDEVERKWLISEELYNSLLNLYNYNSDCYNKKITQFVDDNGVRYRKLSSPTEYIKCIKSDKSEFTRYEMESLIDKDLYETKLAEFKNSDKYFSLINKERTTIKITNYANLEINRHKIGSNYFYTAEIEYKDYYSARVLDLNDIITDHDIGLNDFYEFTNSKEISNKILMKLNARKKTEIEEFSNYVNSLCKNCFIKIEK
jgi:CYTH domain-containing protein